MDDETTALYDELDRVERRTDAERARLYAALARRGMPVGPPCSACAGGVHQVRDGSWRHDDPAQDDDHPPATAPPGPAVELTVTVDPAAGVFARLDPGTGDVLVDVVDEGGSPQEDPPWLRVAVSVPVAGAAPWAAELHAAVTEVVRRAADPTHLPAGGELAAPGPGGYDPPPEGKLVEADHPDEPAEVVFNLAVRLRAAVVDVDAVRAALARTLAEALLGMVSVKVSDGHVRRGRVRPPEPGPSPRSSSP